MAGETGVPTGLAPTAGVDYSIALPYAVPSIVTNRVGYYFAASTLGDAYRMAVAGDASQYAWIAAAAQMDDTHFALAFPPQAGLENLRSWFRAAYAALEGPGSGVSDVLVTVSPEGAATISSKAQSAATTPSPDLLVTTGIGKDVQAQLGNQVVTDTGLPAANAGAGAAMPKWLLYGGLALAAILLFAFLRKRS